MRHSNTQGRRPNADCRVVCALAHHVLPTAPHRTLPTRHYRPGTLPLWRHPPCPPTRETTRPRAPRRSSFLRHLQREKSDQPAGLRSNPPRPRVPQLWKRPSRPPGGGTESKRHLHRAVASRARRALSYPPGLRTGSASRTSLSPLTTDHARRFHHGQCSGVRSSTVPGCHQNRRRGAFHPIRDGRRASILAT